MVRTLVEAVLIVTLVVFVFLGSPRSVLIPVIAIPLSLIGTFTMMLVFGFSINLLTLLALVLAIGLVVDDAIIVVENVNRHLEDGMRPIPAAMQAAHELARTDHRDDRGADRGLCADRFPGRPDRRAVHRVRLHPGRRGHGVRDHRADAVADDDARGCCAPHAPGARDWESRLVAFIDRGFGAAAPALPALAARQPELSCRSP